MINYVPLGSVVLLKGASQKLLVISRGINVKHGEDTFFFEYGGVPYPDGLISDRMAYFNHENISKVVFEGCNDIENRNMVENINRYVSEHQEIKKGDVKSWFQP